VTRAFYTESTHTHVVLSRQKKPACDHSQTYLVNAGGMNMRGQMAAMELAAMELAARWSWRRWSCSWLR